MSKAISIDNASSRNTVRILAGGPNGPRTVIAERETSPNGYVGWTARDEQTGVVINPKRPIKHMRDLRHAVNVWARANG